MSFCENDHIRHYMYEDIYTYLSGLKWDKPHYRILDFGSKWFGDPDGGWQTHMRTMFKGILGNHRMEHVLGTYPEFDIHHLRIHSDSFDILIADQVLEHVERPWVATEEIFRVLKSGGIAVVATPGLYPIHPSPLDCWRIMPDGYKVLFPTSKWEHVRLQMWGNQHRVGYEYLYNGGFPYGPPTTSVSQAMKQPYYSAESDKRCPLMVWWIGKKR